MRLGLAVGLLVMGCSTPSADFPSGESVDVDPDPECEAIAETTRLRGVLRREDLRRGMEGLFLDSDGKRWVLSYSVPQELAPWVGKRVEVLGTPCERHGRALVGPHLNPERVRRVE